MTWLALSIFCSTIILVLFRLFPKYGAHTLPAIVINYAIAAGFGYAMLPGSYSPIEKLHEPWMKAGLSLGVLFISLFYLMAFTAQRTGVGVTSIAVKMSLVIPVAWFMITDSSDPPTLLKILAIIMAIAGVILSTRQKSGSFQWSYLLFPVIIFLGSGVIDLVIGYFSNASYLKSGADQILFTSLPFTTAVVIGSVILLVQKLQGKDVLNRNTLIGGVILGLVNYGSIYFLVRTFDAAILDRSAIIPVNNLGVVVGSSLFAILAFREAYSPKNYFGLALAVLSIALLLLVG